MRGPAPSAAYLAGLAPGGRGLRLRDDPRRVDWKASARRDALIARADAALAAVTLDTESP